MWRVSYVKDLNASWLQCIPQNGLVIVMYLYPQRNLFVQTDCALRKLHHANPFMCHGPASSWRQTNAFDCFRWHSQCMAQFWVRPCVVETACSMVQSTSTVTDHPSSSKITWSNIHFLYCQCCLNHKLPLILFLNTLLQHVWILAPASNGGHLHTANGFLPTQLLQSWTTRRWRREYDYRKVRISKKNAVIVTMETYRFENVLV